MVCGSFYIVGEFTLIIKRIVTAVVAGVFALALAQPAFANEKKEEEGASKPEFEYVQLEPISLPIITNKGLTQQVSLIVSLEVPSAHTTDVTGFKPRLTDAYIQDLYGALGAGHAMMRGNLLDITKVKARLSSVTDRVLGPDIKAHDVLLQVVQQRPM